MRPRLAPRCVAPLELAEGDPRWGTPDEPICGQPATEEREVEGLVCPLCASHAAEIDRELATN